MKVHELFEKISTTLSGKIVRAQIEKELPAEFMSWYKANVKHMPFYAYKADQDAKVSSSEGIYRTTEWLYHFLEKLFTAECKKYSRDIALKTIFKPLRDNIHGHYDDNKKEIVITDKFSNDLGKELYSFLTESFIDNGFTVVNYFEFNSRMGHQLDVMCEVFVHELTHSIQFARSKIKDQYRSYLVKDKQKFWAMLKADNHDAAYLGSPEEIESFAQETVYGWLKHGDNEDLEYQLVSIEDWMKYLKAESTRYSRFKDSTDKKEIKVKQRFMKKVYQELDARRDAVLKDIKASK